MGIINKTEELLLSFTSELPHIICLSEHHLKDYEINTISLNQYILASQYSRKNFRQGGVCIFIRKNIQFSKINNMVNCKEKDLELCAIPLHLLNMCIVCVYRAPSGYFLYFLKNLEEFLNKLNRNSKNIIICEDVNINYIINNSYKEQLDSLMVSYGLYSILHFQLGLFITRLPQ
jgi:exonuclease III